MPDAQFPTTAPYTITHQWPWRRNEFTTMAVFALICLGVCVLFIPGVTGILAGVASAAGAVFWLYRVKRSRVTISGVEATVDGTRLTVYSKGALANTFVDLAAVEAINVRRFGSDECFMLADGSTSARLPLRITGDPIIRAALDHAWTNAQTRSPEAVDMYARVTTGDLPG